MSAKKTSCIGNEKHLSAKIPNISQTGNNTQLIVAFVKVNLTLETVSALILIFPYFVFLARFLSTYTKLLHYVRSHRLKTELLEEKRGNTHSEYGHFLRSDISSK